MHRHIACAVLAALACSAASAAVSVTSGGFTYAQNFNSLATATSSPTINPWANDSTLPGWSLFTSTGAAPATYRGELGNQDVGSFTSYGSSASNERALGAIGDGNAYFGSPAGGAVAGYIAVSFTNDSGTPLDSFTLGFKGEQWRHSSATAQTMVLEYGLGATFASVANWTAPGGSFDWTSPMSGGVGQGGINGNGVGAVLNRGGTASLSWAAGQTLWIRWIERNEVGADHGMGIDDLTFSVTAAPVPEPARASLLLAGVLAVAAAAARRRRG